MDISTFIVALVFALLFAVAQARVPQVIESSFIYSTTPMGQLEMATGHFNVTYDEPLYLAQSQFCAPRLNGAQNKCSDSLLNTCARCDFTVCPPQYRGKDGARPLCFDECDTQENRFISSRSCGADSIGTNVAPWKTVEVDGVVPLLDEGGQFEYKLYRFFVARSCQLIDVRVTPTVGTVDLYASQTMPEILEFDNVFNGRSFTGSSKGQRQALDSTGWKRWRGTGRRDGEQVRLRICPRDDTAMLDGSEGAGTYYMSVYTRSLHSNYTVSVRTIGVDALPPIDAALAESSAAQCAARQAEPDVSCLVDSQPHVFTSEGRRATGFAVFEFGGACQMVEVSAHAPDNMRPATVLSVTDDASDVRVDNARWQLSDYGDNVLSLSFCPRVEQDGDVTTLRIRLSMMAPGSVELVATARARFSYVRLDTLAPLTARHALTGATSAALDGVASYCARDLTRECDERYWMFAASNLVANPFVTPPAFAIVGVSKAESAAFDPVHDVIADMYVPSAHSWQSLWVISWRNVVGTRPFVQFPLGVTPDSVPSIVFNNRLVSALGERISEPVAIDKFAEHIDGDGATGDDLCDIDALAQRVQKLGPQILATTTLAMRSPSGALDGRQILNSLLGSSVLAFDTVLSTCYAWARDNFFVRYEKLDERNSEACVHDIGTEAYASDPCCNSVMLWEQCCAPRPVTFNLSQLLLSAVSNVDECTVIDNFSRCRTPPNQVLRNAAQAMADLGCRDAECSLISAFAYRRSYDVRLLENVGCPRILEQTRDAAAWASYYSTCRERVYGSQPTVGLPCSRDADCAAVLGDGVLCDMVRLRCTANDTVYARRFVECIDDTMPGVYDTLTGLVDETSNKTTIKMDCVGARNLAPGLRSHFRWTSDDTLGCEDECTSAWPVIACHDRGCPVPSPCDCDLSTASACPEDACPKSWVERHVTEQQCLSEHLCNWHACIGLTAQQCSIECLAPANDHFCGVCDSYGACFELDGVASEQACADAADQVCALADGTVAWPCTEQTLAAAAQSRAGGGMCDAPCAGERCTSAVFPYGVCLSPIDTLYECEERGGVWRLADDDSPLGACVHLDAFDEHMCPDHFEWHFCEQLSVAQCSACAGTGVGDALCPHDAHTQALINCFVDVIRECETRAECEQSGGWCTNETQWAAPSLSPSESIVPAQYFRASPLLTRSLFMNMYAEPPSPGACVFDADSASTQESVLGYRWCNDADFPRGRLSSLFGCIDYHKHRSASSCEAADGRWMVPGTDAEQCAANAQPPGTVCFDEFNGRFSYRNEAECALCGQAALPLAGWASGRWTGAQMRRARWLKRAYAPKYQWAEAFDFDASHELGVEAALVVLSRMQTTYASCRVGQEFISLLPIACDCSSLDDAGLADAASDGGAAAADACATLQPVIQEQRLGVSVVCPGLVVVVQFSPLIMEAPRGSFSSARKAYEGLDECVSMRMSVRSASEFVSPQRPSSAILADDPADDDDWVMRPRSETSGDGTFDLRGWHSARNAQGRRVGWLVGDGIMLGFSEPTLNGSAAYRHEHGGRAPSYGLDDFANFTLSFDLRVELFIAAALSLTPAQRVDMDNYLTPDLAVPHPDYADSVLPLGLVGKFLKDGNLRVQFDIERFEHGHATLLPVLREVDGWQRGQDEDALTSADKGLFYWGAASYTFVCVVATVELIVFLAIQGAFINASHLVIFGIGCFALVRAVYFYLLVGGVLEDAAPVIDFALVQVAPFVFAATFVVMLVHWWRMVARQKQGGSATFNSDEEATREQRVIWLTVLTVNGSLFLVYALFVALFAVLNESGDDQQFCGVTFDAATTGYSRSDDQRIIQIVFQAFLTVMSLSVAVLFLYYARYFYTLLPRDRQRQVFHFKRPSKVTAVDLTAKLFQTTIVLTVVFIGQSIFLLLLYLFSSFHESSWSVAVLFVLEVLPCLFLTYQLHPKFTLKRIYSKRRHRRTSTQNRSGASGSSAASAEHTNSSNAYMY
jgi:hypothetical protein